MTSPYNVSPLMSLNIPIVGVTTGPDWATLEVLNWSTLDIHDHSSGKGQQVTQAGLNITGTLSLNSQALTGVNYATLVNQSALISGSIVNTIYDKGGDLYFNDSAGNQVRITASGAVNTGATGSISGMDGSAAVTYSAVNKTFTFTQSSTFPAKLVSGDILIYETVSGAASAVTVKVPAGFSSAYSLTLLGTLPATSALVSIGTTGILATVAAPGAATSLLQQTTGGALSWVTTLPSGLAATSMTLTTPVLSGSITGTYTLGGTPTITAPILSGTITGTYTLGGTPTLTSPTVNGATMAGATAFSGTPTFSASVKIPPTVITAASTNIVSLAFPVLIANRATAIAVKFTNAVFTASAFQGAILVFYNVGVGTLTISPATGDSIDNTATKVLTTGQHCILYAAASPAGYEWITIA